MNQTMELLLERHPESVSVADRNGRLPLHLACCFSRIENVQLLIQADLFTVVRKTNAGRTPLQFALRRGFRVPELEAYLLARQTEAVDALKTAWEAVVNDQLGGLPDLVVAEVWGFALPDLWQQPE